jgi:hypothetical protein
VSGLYLKYPKSGGTADGVGVTSIATFGVTPNPAGGTISSDSSTLTLQPANLTNPGGVSTTSQTFAGVKTFNSAPIFSSVTASSPLRTDASGQVSVGSISLINEVRDIMPLSSLGSISLETAVIGSLSLARQVRDTLPLSYIGSISLTSAVVGSLSLANQVKDILPLSMIGSISLATATVASLSLTNQVTGVLPLANGGTATSSAFTEGSVIFAGPGGVYAQDNTGFFFDAANDRLGVGLASPSFQFHVSKSQDASTQFVFLNPGSGSNSRAWGLFGTDSSTNNMGFGWSNGTFNIGAGYEMLAANTGWVFGNTNADGITLLAAKSTGFVRFATGGFASANERVRIDSAGNFGIATTGPTAVLHVVGSALISAGLSVPAGQSSIMGRLGVGIAAPTAQLHVVGSSILSAGIAVGPGISKFADDVKMSLATIGSVTHTSSTDGAAYTLTWPGAQGGANTVPTNDGSGNLAWTSATGLANPMTTLGDMIIGTTSGTAARLAVGSTGYTLVSNPSSPTVVAWQNETSPTDLKNIGLAPTVTGGTLVISMVGQENVGFSASSPGVITFRSGTNSVGSTFRRMVTTGSVFMTLSAGSNLGVIGSATDRFWVYASDDLGTVRLATSRVKKDESGVCSISLESAVVNYDVNDHVWATTTTGMQNGMAMSLTTTQQLATAYATNVIYYTTMLGTASFRLAASPGGTVVGSGSVGSGSMGVHTFHAQHAGLVTSSATGGSGGLPIRLIGTIVVPPSLTINGSFSSTTVISAGGYNQPQYSLAPTITTLSSGSGTYFPPVNAKWLKVINIAGGGGGGDNTADGAAGATSTFGSASGTIILVSTGGAAGAGAGAPGGAGGTASGGDLNLTGGGGFAGSNGASSPAGAGGIGILGGNGLGGGVSSGAFGTAGAANSGAGGGGSTANSIARNGGGAGGIAIKYVRSVGASYKYLVGDGGAGGGTAAKGGTGVIIVEEYYS